MTKNNLPSTKSVRRSVVYDKLKDANNKLRKSVATLRKKVRILEDEIETSVARSEEYLPETKKKEGKNTTLCVGMQSQRPPRCSKCNEKTILIQAGVFTIRKCTECTWTERLKNA